MLLHDNQLSRPVPAWLGNLSRLRSLNLSINGFTGGIPPELGRLSNLSYLNLRSNDLTGPVPTELGNLSNLEQLYLYENQLSGEIPDSLGRLSNLKGLWLQSNQLSGEIPTDLGRLVNLTRLSLRDNQLTGKIPAELGNLTKLELIRLAGNQLTGCVPTGLRNVAINDFSSLALSFCGETPTAATDREALIALYNATGGANWTNRTNWRSNSPISDWHGVTTNDDGKVTELRLLENGLAGPIPGTLGNLSSLNRLNLGDNALTGTIPAELQNLGNLQQFYLWNNRLTGPVPAWLGNLTNLKRLGLSGNRLEGMVPGTLGNLSNLNLINFGGNDLTGPIPTQLQNLGNLEELNLWENRFTGPVPSWLGNLSNSTRINLRDNQLTGPIPSQLGNLSALTHLALADNLLSGQIPPELGNLTKLERIHLAGNQLTGCVPESLRHVADNDFLGLILPFCGSSSQPAATEVRRFRDPDVPYLMWEVGPGVPDLHYEYLREGIVHIHRYATPLGLPPLPDDATFYLYADLDLMAQTLARLESWRSLENARQYVADGNWGGLAGLEDEDSGWIMVHLRNVARSGNPSDLPHVAAHELSHVYQYTLQNHGRFDNTHSEVHVIGPAWMQEGFAEFHGMAALAQGGIRPYEQRRQQHLSWALRVDVSLKETETYNGLLGGPGRFDLAGLAAELLASQSSAAALIRYWTLLGPDTTWQQAFQTAFGMTIDDFYTRFADHRANGYPTVTLP